MRTKNVFCCTRHTCRRIHHFLTRRIRKHFLVIKDRAKRKADFRVEEEEIPSLVEALRVPLIFKCINGTITIERKSCLCRYSDMILIFLKSISELGINSNEVIDCNSTEDGHRVTPKNHGILNLAHTWTQSTTKSSSGHLLWTACEPDNGVQRTEAVKSQSVTLPNGLIAHLLGPIGQ